MRSAISARSTRLSVRAASPRSKNACALLAPACLRTTSVGGVDGCFAADCTSTEGRAEHPSRCSYMQRVLRRDQVGIEKDLSSSAALPALRIPQRLLMRRRTSCPHGSGGATMETLPTMETLSSTRPPQGSMRHRGCAFAAHCSLA